MKQDAKQKIVIAYHQLPETPEAKMRIKKAFAILFEEIYKNGIENENDKEYEIKPKT